MIRFPKEEDYTSLLRMSRAFAEASPYRDLTVSEEGVQKILSSFLLSDKTEQMVLLASDGDNVFGMIAGYSVENYLWKERTVHELIWWVDPEHRRTRDSLLLFRAFELWADKIQAKQIVFSDIPEVTDLGGFYQKKGYRKLETSWVKNLREGK